MKARLILDIKFSKLATDAEALATALDKVIAADMAHLGDCWDEYGGKPKVGKFLVLDTEQAKKHAETLDRVIALSSSLSTTFSLSSLLTNLAPVRDFLRQVAGKA